MHYFTAIMLTSLYWGFHTLLEAQMGKVCVKGSVFTKFIVYGIAILMYYLFNTNEINNDLSILWSEHRKMFITFVLFTFIFGISAQYFLYTAHNKGVDKSHIVFVAGSTVPIVISTIGAYLYLNESINIQTLIGILVIFAGVGILRVYN